MASAEELKAEGNKFFAEKKYGRAVHSYTAALKLEPENHFVLCNRSFAFLKAGKPVQAERDACAALKVKPGWGKALYRKGMALAELGRLAEARDALLEANRAEPESRDIATQLRAVMKQLGEKDFSMIFAPKAAQPAPAQAPAPAPAQDKGEAGGEEFELRFELTKAFSEENVERFRTQLLHNFTAQAKARLAIEPHALVLHPAAKEAVLGRVSVRDAFHDPPNLEEFANFMRGYAKEHEAHAVMVVASKADISFPPVWGSTSWRHGKNGYFMHLEDRTGKRRVWFLPTDKEMNVAGEAEELDVTLFGIMPPFFLPEE